MPKFISDDEMEQLESSAPKKIISDEEMAALEGTQDNSVSELESLVRGAGQGASFGLADELTGGTEALGRATFGDDSLKDLLENYTKYRDESRKAYTAAEEANPTASMIGNIAGSIAPSLLTGGAGAVGNLGRVAAKESAKQLAKAGAIQGGLNAFGVSEADPLSMEMAKDVGVGSGLGAGVGLVAPSLVKGAGAVGAKGLEAVKDKLPTVFEKGGQAFDLAKKGVDVVGRKAKDALAKESKDVANDLLKAFRKQYGEGSEKVGQALKSNMDGVDFANQIDEIEQALQNSSMAPDDMRKVLKELENYKQNIVTETTIPGKDIAQKNLEKLIEKNQGKADLLKKNVSFGDAEATSEENFLQSLMTRLNKNNQVVGKNVLSASVPEDKIVQETSQAYRNLSLEDLNNLKKDLNSKIFSQNIDSKTKSILSKSVKEIDDIINENLDQANQDLLKSGNTQMSKVYSSGDIFGELAPKEMMSKDLDIPLSKKLLSSSKGGEVERILGYGENLDPKLVEKVKDLPVRKELEKNLAGEGGMLGGFINPKGAAIRVGEALGKTSKTIQPVSDFTKKILTSDNAYLNDVARIMLNNKSPAVQGFGKNLQKAVNDSSKRDRLLWSLSQQPTFREYFNSQTEESDK